MQNSCITQSISLYYSWLFVNINIAVAFASILQLSKRLYKSFLDHRLAALIRIFFGDYASSFTSAYFSSLSYSWKRAEFSLFYPCHSSSLLYLLSKRPCAVPPSTHHFHSSVCFLLFYQSGEGFRILTKIIGFVRQNTIITQKFNKSLTKL